MVGAIAAAVQQEPLVVGKPSTFMLDHICRTFGISEQEICMVGDRLDTDIAFGQAGGVLTLLVLSGVTTKEVLHSPETVISPDFYTDALPDLLQFCLNNQSQ
jgi:phosphoglycolate phosphatase